MKSIHSLRNRVRTLLHLVAGLFFQAALTIPVFAQQSFNFQTLDGAAYGISDGNIGGDGFIYNGTAYTSTSLPGPASGISGVNIVGFFTDSDDVSHGFLYNGTGNTTLDVPGANDTIANGISGNSIVGYYEDNIYSFHGFLYNGVTYTTLDFPNAVATYANGISAGNIVGWYEDANYNIHSFLFNGTVFSALDVPGANFTVAYGISGSNIVGIYADATGTHGFYYNGTAFTAIDVPGADQADGGTYAKGVSGGSVVGYYFDGPSSIKGFLAVPVPPVPKITTQPGNQTVIAGNTTTFNAASAGTPAPTFLWQISVDGGNTWANLTEGGNITGSKTALLSISNTTGSMSGSQFRVVATNSLGAATSNAAMLTVITAPVINTQPTNVAIVVGKKASFSVTAIGAGL